MRRTLLEVTIPHIPTNKRWQQQRLRKLFSSQQQQQKQRLFRYQDALDATAAAAAAATPSYAIHHRRHYFILFDSYKVGLPTRSMSITTSTMTTTNTTARFDRAAMRGLFTQQRRPSRSFVIFSQRDNNNIDNLRGTFVPLEILPTKTIHRTIQQQPRIDEKENAPPSVVVESSSSSNKINNNKNKNDDVLHNIQESTTATNNSWTRWMLDKLQQTSSKRISSWFWSKNPSKELSQSYSAPATSSFSSSTSTFLSFWKDQTSAWGLKRRQWQYSVRRSVANGWERVRQSSASTLSSAGTWISTHIRHGMHTIRIQLQSKIQTVARRIQTYIQNSIRNSTNRVRQSISSFGQNHVIHPIQNIWQHQVVDRWKSINFKNSFWWWSLTAIAVYGISTTVPKELVRQQRQSQPPQKPNTIAVEEEIQ
jgi:hypothetical protein